MGLTRQYLRYAPCDVFGVIGSYKSNIVYLDLKGVRGKYCAVGTCEDVIVWDIRTGDKARSNLLLFPNNIHLFSWFCQATK